MSYELDEDILQDFLIEAAEILELLSEQLVELESNPEDSELLNAIFRGFHTVKGGAGFLALNELVDTCHGAENVFDILRTGKRQVTSSLMDTMLQALDTINVQFSAVQERESMESATPELLQALKILSQPESDAELNGTNEQAEVSNSVNPTNDMPDNNASSHDSLDTVSPIDEITDDEFDKLLDELHGEGKSPSSDITDSPASSDEITDDEFEALLDNLHGSGKGPASKADQAGNDDITDDEFDALLDELHGVGKGPAAKDSPEENTDVSSPSNGLTDELMTDDAFDQLLDELHGAGKGPAKASVSKTKTSNDMSPTSESKPDVSTSLPTKKARADTPAKKAAPVESTVRVNTSTLDTIMNMVGELVLVRNRLISLGMHSNDEEVSKAVANLDIVTADLQGAVMKTRMQPIKKVFGRFPRVVRDLARNLNKDIKLTMVGEETDLDKNLVEALSDPLVHLVRNSVDHGIELPEERVAAGKSASGTVTLSAAQEGDHILLSIEDDGKGMDPDKLRGIAVSRGVMDEDAASRLTDKECFNLIFMPGFSSKEEISDISGRGVGMDVVKTAINTLNGSIDIDSTMGSGTMIQIKVPLTLAILPTLMVGIANYPFALPLGNVNEIFHLDLTRTNIVDGQLTIIVREKSIPLFYLQNWLVPQAGMVEPSQGKGHVVIVQLGSQRIGFVVDTLIGQEEVVIKPLDHVLQGTPGMAGATITSDGQIALILDIPNLLKAYASASRF
ncbi:chemotaxis protein CheA [Vibrio sp.]|nr:chemotaxis protein CheA [Vibrio sp.]